jgi:hypothetical protein
MNQLIWSEYCPQTRLEVMEKFNLSEKQCNILVKAYDDIAFIGAILCRSEIQTRQIMYTQKNSYEPLPRLMRKIVDSIPKNDFSLYFSPMQFPSKFESFVRKILTTDIQNGADILGQGTICYRQDTYRYAPLAVYEYEVA